MIRLAVFLWIVLLTACGAPEPRLPQSEAKGPRRIVSLDYCADQYVLKLADPDQVLAVSPDAAKDFSYMRSAAEGVAIVRPTAEDVLLLEPDLIVRSYGGGPNAAAFFERAGVPVLQIGWASEIAGQGPGSIAHIIQTTADGLGQRERGAALASEYHNRLQAVAARRTGETTLYMTPGGVTTGPGSLVHEMMVAAGRQNYESQPGWRALPLERLVMQAPDHIAAAFYDEGTDRAHAWSVARHPLARAQIEKGPVTHLPGAWTACGGWFILDAVEALAADANP